MFGLLEAHSLCNVGSSLVKLDPKTYNTEAPFTLWLMNHLQRAALAGLLRREVNNANGRIASRHFFISQSYCPSKPLAGYKISFVAELSCFATCRASFPTENKNNRTGEDSCGMNRMKTYVAGVSQKYPIHSIE